MTENNSLNNSLNTSSEAAKFSFPELLPTLLFVLTTLSLASYQLFRAYNVHYSQLELIFIVAFSTWVLTIGIVDIKTRHIPLWLTSPVIIASLVLHSIYPPEAGLNKTLIPFQMSLFDAAMGVSFGFIMIDLITHFGNWLAKYPKSTQGLVPISVFIPVSIVFFFAVSPNLAYWSLPLAVVLTRLIFSILYSKNNSFKSAFEWPLQNPLIIYSIFFILIFIQACAVLYNKVEAPFIKINYVLLALSGAFILEEVLIPVFDWIKTKVSKKPKETLSQTDEEQPSVLGGGDASLTAALGAVWGAIIMNNCLLLAFLLAFILVGSYKLLVFILQKRNSELSPAWHIKEIPFAPFITISAQVVLLAEILVKAPGAASCGLS